MKVRQAESQRRDSISRFGRCIYASLCAREGANGKGSPESRERTRTRLQTAGKLIGVRHEYLLCEQSANAQNPASRARE